MGMGWGSSFKRSHQPRPILFRWASRYNQSKTKATKQKQLKTKIKDRSINTSETKNEAQQNSFEVQVWTKFMQGRTKDEVLSYKVKEYFNPKQLMQLWARFNRKELPTAGAEVVTSWKKDFTKANGNENKN